MCLCDTATDCNAATNWHDLGVLEVEKASRSFQQTRMQPIGGYMFETYSEDDMYVVWPELLTSRVLLVADVLKECASRGPI
jgi:hypothetical protein